MNDIELLESTINEAGSINVPVGLIEQIGLPLARIYNNLRLLHASVTEGIRQQQECGMQGEAEPQGMQEDEVLEPRPEDDQDDEENFV